MAKKQSFGQKVNKGKSSETFVKVIYSHKPEDKVQYSFREKLVTVPEGQDIVKTAQDALK